MVVQTYVDDGENGGFFLLFPPKAAIQSNYCFGEKIRKILRFPRHQCEVEQPLPFQFWSLWCNQGMEKYSNFSSKKKVIPLCHGLKNQKLCLIYFFNLNSGPPLEKSYDILKTQPQVEGGISHQKIPEKQHYLFLSFDIRSFPETFILVFKVFEILRPTSKRSQCILCFSILDNYFPT